MRTDGRLYEYRINKKGCECYRTRSHKDLGRKLNELTAAHPNTKFAIQTRYVPTTRHGAPRLLPNGEPQWSTWA